MSGILQAISFITPLPPQPLSRDYDGFQVCWKMFCFRPSVFTFEAWAFGLLGLYLLAYVAGKAVNVNRAKSTIQPYITLIRSQFSSTRPLLHSSPALHLLFATGRRSVLALHTTISLYPIHDLPMFLFGLGRSFIEPTYVFEENVVFDFTIGHGADGVSDGTGVVAIVSKDGMKDVRSKRWDLTFTKLAETSAVPITHALFTEHSDLTDLVLKTPNVGVSDLLKDSDSLSVLKYLLVSDVAAERPAKGPIAPKSKSRHVILSVHKPSSPAQVEAVKAWVQVALNLSDLLAKGPSVLFKPDVARKLIKTRQTVDASLLAAYQKEKLIDSGEPTAEETAEEKRLAKKKAERAKMSEKELKRAEELDKKREMRKLQKKQMSK
ncbi:hypothetical protein B9479_001249 [Cryptococcus floricola]|uniref:DUF1682 domain-containing protein n=1 Tax=Cryptococcus floricola TaxID=2591691 RepID=A0A5D3B7L3_9TREE|nr:hypothetical protein B9479_001249 [Cryptococcus floricola]